MKIKTMMGQAQQSFEFVAELVAGSYRRPAVLTLQPFCKGIELEAPSAWAWNDGNVTIDEKRMERCRRDAQCNGVRRVLRYETWLEWASALNGGAR